MKRLLLAGLVSVAAHAHEGHEHSGPAALKPQKSGIVKGNEKYFIEVAHQEKSFDVYIYPTTTDLKAPKTLDPSTVQLTATVELPRQKAAPMALTPAGDHLTASFDTKKAHRVTVYLKVEGEHGDTLKYTFEKRM